MTNEITKISAKGKSPAVAPEYLLALREDFDSITRFSLYTSASSILESMIPANSQVHIFVSDLKVITKYMLDVRHAVTEAKRKEKIRVRDEEGKLIFKAIDTDLLRYMGIEKRTKVIQPRALDIVKFYKALEQTVLSNKVTIDWESLELGDFKPLCSKLFDSLPTLLLSVDALDKEEKKNTLTLVFSSIVIYRQFKVKSEPSVKTLTDPYSGESLDLLRETKYSVEEMGSWVDNIISKEDMQRKLAIKLYAGNASSPNSGASAKHLESDLRAVSYDRGLWDSIVSFGMNFENFNEFYYLLNCVQTGQADLRGLIRKGENPIHSRLFHFTAPGGKSRIIANVDWVTQSVLSPLHYFLFDILKTIKSDFTFDHRKGLDYIFSGPNSYFSIDLSAATDRMPRVLQSKLIETIFNRRGENGKEISESWLKIVDREYSTKGSPLNGQNPIRYSVGQGMGLFTSWTIMALLHHYIVNHICDVPMTDYALVGDDLVIKGDKSRYIKYVAAMKEIGLEVNMSKSIVSEGDDIHIEFARNYIIKGERIIPLQFGTLFAWRDEKVSLDSFIFTSNWTEDQNKVGGFIHVFSKYLTPKKLACLFFFYYRNKLERSIDFTLIKEWHKIPEWIEKEVNYSRILEITKRINNSFKSSLESRLSKEFKDSNSIVTNLASQLVVRNANEVFDIEELIVRVIPLTKGFATKKYGDAIFNRLNSVQIIQYHADYLGNPLINKRERKLIEKVIDHHLKIRNSSG